MRPGQIRVFDGLRVTTEHVDHFQASLHSAIQDIREIIGLGVVYAGFSVVATGSDSVTVQPGIAFDRQKNRIVCDEPQQLAVSFAPDQNAAYVCAKYDQIEGGETEGRKTLIWDSCTVSLRPAMPDAEDDVLPLAMLTRNEDGSLTVSDLTAPFPAPRAAEAPDEAKPQPVEWSVRQGVLGLAGTPSGAPASVSSLLSAAAGVTPQPAAGGEVCAPLAAAELPAGLTWSAVTCYAVVSATLNAPAAPPASSYRVDVSFRASSTGEATIADGGVSQFALTANGVTSELSEGVVLSLPLDPFGQTPAGTVSDDARELLARMRLRVRLEPSGGTAIKAVAHLSWSGAWSDQAAQRLDEYKVMLTWTCRLAWKGVGRSTLVTVGV